MVVLAGARRVGLGLGRPGVITSELRLSRTKYIHLHGGGLGQDQEMKGLGRPPFYGQGCLEANGQGSCARYPQPHPGPDMRCLGLWGTRPGE